jgi:hypothetical protein
MVLRIIGVLGGPVGVIALWIVAALQLLGVIRF